MRLRTCALAALILVACANDRTEDHAARADTTDSAFAALQQRGATAMGVDQYTSQHRFEDLADGGRIELQRDSADPQDIATIRAHLQEIATAFQNGNFRTPGFVHEMEVPGTTIMSARRAVIQYTYRELPRGGEVRIATADPEALQAVRQFLAFQRQDHRSH
ncbi:MAG: hypothetical protein ACRENP_22050 [Longimicrobiales bacterium]